MSEILSVEATYDGGNLNKGLADARKELAQTAVAAVKLDSSLKGSVNGTKQATNALSNFGRVVQDAPFGIIGITNNINPLLESFQRLKSETGSTGAAIKALASSLIGGGGLGLAVSVVTSLMTVFALSNRGAGESAAYHKSSLDILKEQLDLVKKAEEEYLKAIDAASSSVVNHQDKLKELNAVMITTANNLDVLSKSIINSSVAQFLAAQKEELVKNLIGARVKQFLDDAKKANPFSNVREFNADLISTDKNKKSIAEFKADLVNLNNFINTLGLENKVADIFTIKPDKKSKGETIQDVIAQLRREIEYLNGREVQLNIDESLKKISALESTIKELTTKFKLGNNNKIILDLYGEVKELKLLNSLDGKRYFAKAKKLEPEIEVVPKLNPVFSAEMIKKLLEQDAKRLEDYRKGLNDLVQSTVVDGLAGLGEGIGRALGGAGLEGIFTGLFNTLANGLKELGKYLIKTYAIIEFVKKIKFTNPVAGIAAGVTLVALGALIQSQINKTRAFATGVRGFEGGTALVGERGPELVTLPRGANVIPNGQTNAMMASGGAGTVVEHRISGRDLLVLIKRAGESNTRLY